MAGPDSVDPKQLLNDLRQIATVCQRLGIDLSKVAAMGQTIGGKGQGLGPYETQNPGHAAFHEGGGTGYTNMAAGAIVGSAVSAEHSKKAFANAYAKANATPRGDFGAMLKGVTPGSPESRGTTLAALEDMYANTPASATAARTNLAKKIAQRKAAGATGALTGVGAGVGAGAGLVSPKKPSPRFMNQIADKATRRMIMTLLTVEGIESIATGAAGFLTEPLHELQGETWALRGAGVAVAGGKMASGLVTASVAMQMATNVSAAMRAAKGLGMLAKFGRAAMAAGPQIAILAAVEVANLAIDQAMTHAKTFNQMKYSLAIARQGRIGPLQGNFTDDAGYVHEAKVAPMTDEYVTARTKQFKDDADEYYIDDWGHRNKRSVVGWAWRKTLRGMDEDTGWLGWMFIAPVKIANRWGRDAENKQVEEVNAKAAAESNKQGMQYAEFMDWDSAKQKFEQAKKVMVNEQDQSFAWKNPNVYLANMESARISGRNWARSQQPRGGDRTGD